MTMWATAMKGRDRLSEPKTSTRAYEQWGVMVMTHSPLMSQCQPQRPSVQPFTCVSIDAPLFPKYEPRRSTAALPSVFSLRSIVMYTWAVQKAVQIHPWI